MPAGLRQAVTTLLRRVVAAEMLPRFRDLGADEVEEKGPGDLVTVVDRRCEAALTEALPALLPGSTVVGEEAASADPSVLRRLEGEAPVWIVDPLDGTANFAAGRDRFGSIVALAQGGNILAGWIYQPIGDRMATAERGQGAWIGDDPAPPPPDGAVLDGLEGRGNAGGLARRYGKPAVQRLKDSIVGIHQMRCAAVDYLDLAENRVGFVLTRNGKPWDHAAGVLIHRERGGVARLLTGVDYVPRIEPETLLLTPEEALWDRIRGLLTT